MSEASESPVKKPNADFLPVEDEKEAKSLLKEAVTTLSSTMLWTKNQEQLIETHLALVSDVEHTLYVWVPPKVSAQTFSDTVISLGTMDCYFSVSAPRANIFFKTQFTGFDEGGLKFKLPDKLFKVQRRKDFRFQIPDGHVLRIELDDPLGSAEKMRPKVLDISAGGLAFVVTETEEALFPVGMTVKNVTFSIKGRKITVDAEVRHKREMSAGSRVQGHKVGVLFQNIKMGDHQHIAAYVFEESRKYFSRFI